MTTTSIFKAAISVASALALLLASVNPATAASPQREASDSGVTIVQPTEQERVAALAKLDEAKRKDPVGFAQRMKMLEHADALNRFLYGDKRFDGRQQQEFVAASIPTEALEGLIEMTDAGVLKFGLTKDSSGRPAAKITKGSSETRMIGGGLHSSSVKPAGLGSLPQCPSAWAAFWAWYANTMVVCEALGFFGPWTAAGCYLALALGGTIIDFNMSC
ncbi:hypothetical protein SPF06_04855 [Sinomonas sp. JGH33]|uniref:Uncharacterized protein n=1 Tax=Sinomonas terricola TaxID=3110330 RepID=A0ABU5T3D7_9MICC|nr:hypothetical protein [Sinomonas sp. JGH33]MEA5454047.1 hypothetical protein [Sinomonas sp. JGH33]